MNPPHWPGVVPSIRHAVGNTPLVHAARYDADLPQHLLLKCEFMNPGGSVKDRIAFRMIEAAERRGDLHPGATIIESTAGNTGVGLALAAAARGYKLICVMTTKSSTEKVALMRALGAEVVIVPKENPPEHPESFLNKSKSLAAQIPGAWLVDQFANPDNISVHFEETAAEIWQQTGGAVDAVVCGIGTGGSMTGIGRALKARKPAVRMVLADPVGSILKNVVERKEPGEFRGYQVEGIGGSMVPKNAELEIVDAAIGVTDAESVAAALKLLATEGVFAGMSSGCALAAAHKFGQAAVARGETGLSIVVLITDGGRGYLSTLYNTEWRRSMGFAAK